jgi:hypothetical protein
MTVTRIRNRRDEIQLVGPLNEIYEAAGPEIEDYLSKGWTFESSKTEPNNGPLMTLRFVKERD